MVAFSLSGGACATALLAAVGAHAAGPLNRRQTDAPDGYQSEPYYPAPFGGWVDSWTDSYEKAKELVDKMTLVEKTNITAGTGIFMGQFPLLQTSVYQWVDFADKRTGRCNGNTGSAPRVGFPQLCLNDAANGIRQADNVTVFPDGVTVGATFDKKLMYERAVAIGKEARGKGVNVWLAPAVGPMGRKPKGGRNWEGFGADPVLQAVGARETIKGIQEQGVIATIKHLIGNEQEMYRMYNPFQYAYSANIDDRTLHELYLWPFAEGVKAGVGSVMTAYNAVNSTASSQNSYLINGILKDELGFQGFVMTDWLAHMSGVASALAGLDMDMPGDTQIPLFGNSYWMYELTRATLNGSVPMERLNDAATRIVATWYQMGQDAEDYPSPNFDTNTYDREGPLYPAAWPSSPKGVVNEFVPVQEDHDVIARQVAQDAITMLKNDEQVLPLAESQGIRVFGTAAQTNKDGPNACPDRNCNKGTLGQGWGSGTVDYMYLDDPISAIRSRAQDVSFYNSDKMPNNPEIKEGDVALVFITSDAGENSYTVEGNHGDRDSSRLFAWHAGDKLVKDVASKYENVIVVAQTVGPLVFEEWHDLPSVKSILIQHLPGQEAGESLTNVLYGDASPCGHLPYSITKKESDMPESVTKLIDFALGFQPQDTYSEGLYIDYRWLNKEGITPRYAFGHGLSYTNFTFSKASIEKVTHLTKTPPAREPKPDVLDYAQDIPEYTEAVKPESFKTVWRYIYSWLSESDAKKAANAADEKYPYPDGYSTTQKPGPRAGGGQGGNPALWDVAYTVSVTVTNAGDKHSGKASVQAYLQFPDDISYDTPIIQLRDFEKTGELAPGESEVVELKLTRKDLSVWDVVVQDWVVPEVDGDYKVWIGEASDSLPVVCHADGLDCDSDDNGPL